MFSFLEYIGFQKYRKHLGGKIVNEPYIYCKNSSFEHASHRMHLTYWTEILWQNLSFKILSLFTVDYYLIAL